MNESLEIFTQGQEAAILIGGVVVAVFAIHCIPVFVASWREHPRFAQILLLTFFFGWTFVGWAIALGWAFNNTQPPVRLSPHASLTLSRNKARLVVNTIRNSFNILIGCVTVIGLTATPCIIGLKSGITVFEILGGVCLVIPGFFVIVGLVSLGQQFFAFSRQSKIKLQTDDGVLCGLTLIHSFHCVYCKRQMTYKEQFTGTAEKSWSARSIQRISVQCKKCEGLNYLDIID